MSFFDFKNILYVGLGLALAVWAVGPFAWRIVIFLLGLWLIQQGMNWPNFYGIQSWSRVWYSDRRF